MADQEGEKAVVRMLLRLLGVANLHVKFKHNAEVLRAEYDQAGKHQVRTIRFNELEKIFNQNGESSRDVPAGPARPPVAP